MSPVAIVGIDCRFPRVGDREALWDLLMRGDDVAGPVPAGRWDDDEPASYGGFIEDVETFDNGFFSISPREAAAMDPQQRLLLQCAWRTLEDGGVSPAGLGGSRTGVYVGVMGNEWATRLTDLASITPELGTGNGLAMIANRVSYLLDLHGPSMAIDTACSSSLVAVHLACNALAAGDCDAALVGGVNLVLTPMLGRFYTEAGLAAPDGRCKPFSAAADGIGRGEGAAFVLLRRAEDALADGQPVYAVIRGSAVNHDGRSNGMTAPSRWAQRDVITEACERARVRPANVRFVEAHGTGTILGDTIEASALGDVHAVPRRHPCAIGSIKGNLGHTEGAAGVAGLIKTALALHHRVVPASRHGRTENPRLRLADKGLRLIKSPLRLSGPDVAGAVSSFGLGGTNAHVVLSIAPTPPPRPLPVPEPAPFTLSAPDLAALRPNLTAQAARLRRGRDGQLAGSCHASNRVKVALRHRFAVTATGREDLAATLERAAADDTLLAALSGRPAGPPRIGLLFTGQGSQYAGMTAAIYRGSALYRSLLDEADAELRPHLGFSVGDLLTGGDERVHDPAVTQPALFAVEYAFGQALRHLGVRPVFVLGHSVGEFAAACLAGVFSLPEAARLVCARAEAMRRLPPGGKTISVPLSHPEAVDLVRDEPLLAVAAVNGPRSVVLAGDGGAIDRVHASLAAAGMKAHRLRTSHAFHSPLMEPAAREFAEVARSVEYAAARVPIYSTVTGGRAGVLDAGYWTAQITSPVLFSGALTAAAETEATHLVELGPRPVLAPLARDLWPGAEDRVLSACSGQDATAEELADLVGALYRAGLDPEWDALYPGGRPAPERLAPYEFSTARRFSVRIGGVPAVAGVARGEPAADEHLTGEAGPVAAGGEPVRLPADTVREAVLSAVREVGGYDERDIGPGTRPLEDLGYDSIQIVRLQELIARRLPGVAALPIRDMFSRLGTVGDLMALAEERAAR